MRLTTIFLNEADGAVYYLWNGDRNEKFSFQNLTNPVSDQFNVGREFSEFTPTYAKFKKVDPVYDEADLWSAIDSEEKFD